MVCLWICHKKWQQVSSPYVQHIFYVFLCQSTICINNSELWDVSGHNSEMRLSHFVTGFWCSLPTHVHEAPLRHLPQHLQVYSEPGRCRSAFTGKGLPAFLRDASEQGLPSCWGSPWCQSFQVYTCRFFCPLLGEVRPPTSFTFRCLEAWR